MAKTRRGSNSTKPPSRPATTPAGPHKREEVSHRRLTTWAALASVLILAVQTCFNSVSIRRGGEQFEATIEEIRSQSETLSRIFQDQQRARLSFSVELDPIQDGATTTGLRILCPFAIGGTTEARHVVFKHHTSRAAPRQHQYMTSAEVDWDATEGHMLSDVSPTESGRRFVTEPLLRTTIGVIASEELSLYFIGRLEYCDIYDNCRYFMRCAELNNRLSNVTYCGTAIGDLSDAPRAAS